METPCMCVVPGLIGWVLAILTDQKALYFYSGGFAASFGQGVSHMMTGEMATLVQLQAGDTANKVAHEWAHTTYFPCLLLQSCLQSMLA